MHSFLVFLFIRLFNFGLVPGYELTALAISLMALLLVLSFFGLTFKDMRNYKGDR